MAILKLSITGNQMKTEKLHTSGSIPGVTTLFDHWQAVLELRRKAALKTSVSIENTPHSHPHT